MTAEKREPTEEEEDEGEKNEEEEEGRECGKEENEECEDKRAFRSSRNEEETEGEGCASVFSLAVWAWSVAGSSVMNEGRGREGRSCKDAADNNNDEDKVWS